MHTACADMAVAMQVSAPCEGALSGNGRHMLFDACCALVECSCILVRDVLPLT